MKKYLVFLLLLTGALMTNADVLYWMVGDEFVEGASAQGESTAATLYAVSGGTAHELDHATGAQVAEWAAVPSSFETDLGGYAGDGFSYYIELWNGKQTDPLTYQDGLNTYIFSPNDPMGMPSALGMRGFGSGSTAYNVPEPTSGLLFLVGGMLLGLRRKRRV